MPFMNEMENHLEPVAIVGMACRLPGSIDSPSKFWQVLREKRSVRTPKVPSTRFNVDAYYHPDLSRPGSYATLGGFFLDGDLVDFDPTFFHMTPIEAQWLDPQQRKMLEVCYEVLENAGLRLDDVAGSNTGVYAATFTSDYQQMSIFERDFRHNYAATGVDPGIISNRINNIFDFNGPSCVINTACSSALFAIHNACYALRERDCDAAIASGSNLILMVDQQLNTAKLGVLSATSECHTFDERADGYARGEGVGALYLKRLSDAIRDKDVIRGVIRTSAVNTNGKVEGMGITFPNAEGQERVLRTAYTRASLDPNQTAYLECHGTGTPIGDPVEVKAVSRGMNDTRSVDKPLIIGAVKPNIGHSEAASGIFATMKAALMTEKAEIPGLYGFEVLNPSIKVKEWNVKIAVDSMPWPAGFDVRRASVSSFGYGGTNAHLVVEAVESLCPWYEHGEPKTTARYTYNDASIDRPFLITMSAHDKKTLTRNIIAHRDIASDYYIPDLAYTLNERRTQFNGARGYTIAWPGRETDAFAPESFAYGSKLSKLKPEDLGIGFVLTGQGSQWARMGCEAMRRFPLFRDTLDALDRVLQRAVEPKHRPSWSFWQILGAPVGESRVDQPDISQPVCTAVQIVIIELFAAWGIRPAVTVGHSSGEIAAAYAAGRISAPEAILVAYFRGLAVTQAAAAGTMLAVGLGVDSVQDYIDLLPSNMDGCVTVACENSPSSTTLSGSHNDIAAVKKVLDEAGIFSRQLETGMAYHSPSMDTVTPLYEQLYTKAHVHLTELDLSWRQPTTSMISSVSGSPVEASHLSISYWCENLRNRVGFNKAVQALAGDTNIKVLVEIGPHAALRAPVAQIIAENNFDLGYVATLARDQDDAVALLKTAGELYLRGHDIKFDMVNSLDSRKGVVAGVEAKNSSQSQGRCLVSLPPYQWNYERKYWYEPRAVAELRTSKHARHDVLGRRIFGLSSNAPMWKNTLRQNDVPWFQYHVLGTDVIFPAAGHISLAIEAFLQQLDLEPAEAGGVILADVDIQKALVVPDSEEGVEVHTRLEKCKSGEWYNFSVESVTRASGHWTLHTMGKIRRKQTSEKQAAGCPFKPIQLHQRVPSRRWYRSLQRVGFRYGPSFQTMTQQVRANGKDRWILAKIKVCTKRTELESRYMLHPSTIDGCFHAIIAAVHRGLHKEMPWGVVPLSIEEMSITFPDSATDLDNDGSCFAWVEDDASSNRHFVSNVQLFGGASSDCLMNIRNLRMVAYETAVPPRADEVAPREPYRVVEWKQWDTDQGPRKMDVPVRDRKVAVLLPNNNQTCSDLSRAIGGSPISITKCNSENLNGFYGIAIDDADGSVLAHATEESWISLQNILLHSGKPIAWVTRGANQGESVNGGLPHGFLRTVRSETPSTKVCLIDADNEAPSNAVASLVQYQLAELEDDSGSAGNIDTQRDFEYWLTKDTRVLVPRLEPNKNLNRLVYGQEEEHYTEAISADKCYQSTLVETQLVWESIPEVKELNPLEVEIQVRFAELTRSDVSPPAGEGGARIVTGTIIRAGGGLDRAMLIGRAAVAYTNRVPDNFLTTHIVTPDFAVMSSHAEEVLDLATSSIPQLSRAVDALSLNSTKELSGQHVVLVASEAATPFTDAFTKLSTHLGFQITVVVDTSNCDEMNRLVSTANVVITTGAPDSEAVQGIWHAMPRHSTFVFGSDTPAEVYIPLNARPLMRGVGLRTCGQDPKTTLETTVAFLDALSSLGHPATTIIDVQELSESLDQTRGRMTNASDSRLLKIEYGESKVKVRKPSIRHVHFAEDSAYVLVGCLGGLGRSITTWMLERGCRNFVFLSRSGATKPEAMDVVGRLTASGASAQIFSVDVSDEKAVFDVVQHVSRRLPIRGVVHAAMVLRDGLYKDMTFSAYQEVLQPKMQGAIALDRALADTPLDFFIMTSSISAVLGNPGQANYAAANSFLDYMALRRRRNGLPACSIALPMVEDVGVVSENATVAEALERKMPFGIDEKEMLTAFEAAILYGQPTNVQDVGLGDVQLVLGLEPDAMLQTMGDDQRDILDAFWYQDTRVSSVRTALEAKSEIVGGQGPGGSFISTLSGMAQDDMLKALGTHIAERTARILGLEPDALELEGASVASYGIDSMIGVELQRWLFTEFGLQIGIATLSGPETTFGKLGRAVAEHSGLIKDDNAN
ncbi:hypothetical protein F5Y19DRAFT_478754 [Xylariaceae sp. FL1651]|nr:hypothetical protein F5Y19DRAFT_478754 [Xylariaceae sp. FL1651]